MRVLVEREWQGGGGVENLVGREQHLDFAGSHVGIDGAFGARADAAKDHQHVLILEVRGALKQLGGEFLRIEDDLHQAGTVAQVDKDDAAVIAPAVHPALEHNLLADLAGGHIAAVARAR